MTTQESKCVLLTSLPLSATIDSSQFLTHRLSLFPPLAYHVNITVCDIELEPEQADITPDKITIEVKLGQHSLHVQNMAAASKKTTKVPLST